MQIWLIITIVSIRKKNFSCSITQSTIFLLEFFVFHTSWATIGLFKVILLTSKGSISLFVFVFRACAVGELITDYMKFSTKCRYSASSIITASHMKWLLPSFFCFFCDSNSLLIYIIIFSIFLYLTWKFALHFPQKTNVNIWLPSFVLPISLYIFRAIHFEKNSFKHENEKRKMGHWSKWRWFSLSVFNSWRRKSVIAFEIHEAFATFIVRAKI